MIYEQDLCSNDECPKRRHCKRWVRFADGNYGNGNVIRSCMGFVAFVPI